MKRSRKKDVDAAISVGTLVRFTSDNLGASRIDELARGGAEASGVAPECPLCPCWQEAGPTATGWYWRAFWIPRTPRTSAAGHWSLALHRVEVPRGVYAHILWWPVPVVPPAPPEGAPSL